MSRSSVPRNQAGTSTRKDIFNDSLPDNLDAERLVLGALLTDPESVPKVMSALQPGDFSLHDHARIFQSILGLAEENEPIDRVTVANALERKQQLSKVGGLTYLVSLDDQMPRLHNIESYIQIVKEKAQLRAVIRQAQDGVSKAMNQESDAAVIAGQLASDMIEIVKGDRRTQGIQTVAQGLAESENGIERLLHPERHSLGLQTGFRRFDEMTGGLREGELVILAARPAMGKTALALNIAQHVATRSHDPKAVAIFSLEMSKESLLTRMLCAEARVDQQRQKIGALNPGERRAVQDALTKLHDAPIYLDDSAGTGYMDVHAKCLQVKQEADLGLVVIDYLQLMPGTGRFENRVQEVSNLSRAFKLLSKELRVPFLVLSQLSRAPEQRPGDHRPQLSDLRESGSLEQDADMVGFIFREEVYRPDKESLRGLAELILAKQRNGPTGRIKLAYLNRYTKFENLALDTGEEEYPAASSPMDSSNLDFGSGVQ